MICEQCKKNQYEKILKDKKKAMKRYYEKYKKKD
tara:strand:- start:143 stop:244 length:102 start_codon:yes stop_codon:yes gene_type:complete